MISDSAGKHIPMAGHDLFVYGLWSGRTLGTAAVLQEGLAAGETELEAGVAGSTTSEVCDGAGGRGL